MRLFAGSASVAVDFKLCVLTKSEMSTVVASGRILHTHGCWRNGRASGAGDLKPCVTH